MSNITLFIIIVLILAFAIGYVIYQKRKGVKCIGCENGVSCSTKEKEQCGCSDEQKNS